MTSASDIDSPDELIEEILRPPCFMVDVTERKPAEEVNAYLAAIVSSSHDAIISKTLNGIVTSWNAAAEALCGYTAMEMIGQPILRIIPPDRRGEEERFLGGCL